MFKPESLITKFHEFNQEMRKRLFPYERVYRYVVDEHGSFIVFYTPKEYREYLENRQLVKA